MPAYLQRPSDDMFAGAPYGFSDRWRSLQIVTWERAGFACESCGGVAADGYQLQVHHKTYVRFMREHPDDLELLCTWCHVQLHTKLRRSENMVRLLAA